MQKEESARHFNDKTNFLSDYIQLNLLAFQYLRNRNYNSAKKSFKVVPSVSSSTSIDTVLDFLTS